MNNLIDHGTSTRTALMVCAVAYYLKIRNLTNLAARRTELPSKRFSLALALSHSALREERLPGAESWLADDETAPK